MTQLMNILPKDPAKRKFVLISGGVVLGVLVLVGVVFGVYYAQKKNIVGLTNIGGQITEQILPDLQDDEVIVPTTSARHLDGMIVANGQSNVWPVCIMVENAAFDGVRPQSGLSRALIVYEVIVEGGITRLMPVFGGEPIGKIGPVRSARDTYIEFVSELDCLYGYAGGSFTAVQATYDLELKTLNALSADGRFYWRDSSSYAPHNLFTSSDLLTLALRDKKLENAGPTFESWSFRDQPKVPSPDARLASSVRIDFSTPSYEVGWEYKSENGYYERTNGGVLHTDAETGEILTARNIVVEIVPPGEYIEGKGRINFSVTGEGKVLIFRSGEVIEGTWKKVDRLSRTQYVDAAGLPIELNRGNTWVEVVPSDSPVEY